MAQLLPGFHIEVRAELTSTVGKVGRQEDGGGKTGLLGHTVDPLQMGLDILVGQKVPSQTGELKYQKILRIRFLITNKNRGAYIPCRLHSGMPRSCGRLRCAQSAPASASNQDGDSPDTGPAPGFQTKTCSCTLSQLLL